MSFSESFIESFLLLILSAALTGFLIPYILRTIDERKARQSKVIEAQALFLNNLSRLVWEFRYLIIKVTYYARNAEKYAIAREAYDEKIWDVINQLRMEISLSRRLISNDSYQQLLGLYDVIVRLDQKLTSAKGSGTGLQPDYQAMKQLNQDIYRPFSHLLDQTIYQIASEMKLVGSDSFHKNQERGNSDVSILKFEQETSQKNMPEGQNIQSAGRP